MHTKVVESDRLETRGILSSNLKTLSTAIFPLSASGANAIAAPPEVVQNIRASTTLQSIQKNLIYLVSRDSLNSGALEPTKQLGGNALREHISNLNALIFYQICSVKE
jgi:hypothetical protein